MCFRYTALTTTYKQLVQDSGSETSARKHQDALQANNAQRLLDLQVGGQPDWLLHMLTCLVHLKIG